jgi:hypothetical protein
LAPFTHRYCPCCSADTTQHFLLHGGEPQDADDELQAICEACEAVLIYQAHGSVGQRAATAEERAAIPPKPDLSKEPWVTMREELRQGIADVKAWIRAGCRASRARCRVGSRPQRPRHWPDSVSACPATKMQPEKAGPSQVLAELFLGEPAAE